MPRGPIERGSIHGDYAGPDAAREVASNLLPDISKATQATHQSWSATGQRLIVICQLSLSRRSHTPPRRRCSLIQQCTSTMIQLDTRRSEPQSHPEQYESVAPQHWHSENTHSPGAILSSCVQCPGEILAWQSHSAKHTYDVERQEGIRRLGIIQMDAGFMRCSNYTTSKRARRLQIDIKVENAPLHLLEHELHRAGSSVPVCDGQPHPASRRQSGSLIHACTKIGLSLLGRHKLRAPYHKLRYFRNWSQHHTADYDARSVPSAAHSSFALGTRKIGARVTVGARGNECRVFCDTTCSRLTATGSIANADQASRSGPEKAYKLSASPTFSAQPTLVSVSTFTLKASQHTFPASVMQLIQLLALAGLATALAAPGGGPGRGGDQGGDHDGHGHGGPGPSRGPGPVRGPGPARGPPTCGQAYEDCQRQGTNLCCQGHKGKHCHTMTQSDCMAPLLLTSLVGAAY
jgi:hypothetical protein